MKIKIITKRKNANFIEDLLAYYSTIDNGSINKILTRKDEELRKIMLVGINMLVTLEYPEESLE